MKLVEGFSTQSSTSLIATSAAGSTQKHRPGRFGRKHSVMVEVAVDGCLDMLTDFTWWRGGILSKLMIQRGILPCSIMKKSARQGNIHSPTFFLVCGVAPCLLSSLFDEGRDVTFVYMIFAKIQK